MICVDGSVEGDSVGWAGREVTVITIPRIMTRVKTPTAAKRAYRMGKSSPPPLFFFFGRLVLWLLSRFQYQLLSLLLLLLLTLFGFLRLIFFCHTAASRLNFYKLHNSTAGAFLQPLYGGVPV